MHLKGDAVGADYSGTSCNALTITSIHLISLPIQCLLHIPLQRVIKYLFSLSPSICFVPSPYALFCFSFIASASGLHHFMSEHYRYLLLSVCRITFVDPSHDLFLNIARSSWYAVELVSKDQAGSRSELMAKTMLSLRTQTAVS